MPPKATPSSIKRLLQKPATRNVSVPVEVPTQMDLGSVLKMIGQSVSNLFGPWVQGQPTKSRAPAKNIRFSERIASKVLGEDEVGEIVTVTVDGMALR